MGRKGRNTRRERNIPLRKVHLVICEGATEYTYVTLLQQRLGAPQRLRVIDAGGRGNISEALKDQRKKFADAIQSVWLILDTEGRSASKLREESDGWRNVARDQICYSHPTIERWFLLHFEESSAELDPKEVIERLQPYIPGYDKRQAQSKEYFQRLYPKPCLEPCLRCACRRARRLETQAREHDAFPPTELHHFIEHFWPGTESGHPEKPDCRPRCAERNCSSATSGPKEMR